MRKALIVFLAFTSLPLFAESKEIDRTISVSGEAVIMVAPNQAVVTIGVETFDPGLEAASLANDRIAKALIAEWKRLGVPDSSIQTSGVTVAIEYARNNDHAKKIDGYVVSRSYDVTADSAATAEKIITRGLASGANQIGRVELRTTEMRKYRDQARVSAVKAAREKAELIASQLRASVGPPRSISETTSNYSWGRQSSMSQNVMSYASDGGDPDTSGAVAPGQIAVRASVSVVFDLIPKP